MDRFDPSLRADPESAGPEPLPLLEPEGRAPVAAGAAAAAAPPPGATTLHRVLSAILPGAGHVARGSWARGMTLLLAWGLLLGVLYLGWGRITVDMRVRMTAQDYVALLSLVLTLALVWGFALYDLSGRARRRALAAGDSQWRIAVRHLRGNKLVLAGLGVIVLLYLIALLAPLIAPYDPIEQRDIVALGYNAPSAQHWFGTDRFGRDILSRILYGARISLSIGFVAVAISITLGTLLGAIAGFFGGKVDAAAMRFTDMVLAFPRLVLLIMIIALFRPTLGLIIAVLGLTQWPGTARLVRGEVLSLRERDFVHAARALGMSRARIILRHLVPNVMAPVIVAATLGIGNTIVLEAGLSFLGLGVQPPTPSWGNMVADGRQNLIGAWWVATFPGLAIVITVLAFNLVGDGLRDALDPRLRG
jgi:peptide/nickel transport system permease protein